MEIPKGLDHRSKQKDVTPDIMVCKLKKSLYGLKQASRCWNHKFRMFLDLFEFKCSEADPCVFVGRHNSATVFLALFVDGLIAAKSKQTIDIILNSLSNNFKIKICNTNVFIGLQIERDRNKKTLAIHQKAYIQKLLEKFEMHNAKVVSVPADPHTILYPVEADEKKVIVPYREAVGNLVFVSSVSRPDITYAVNSVSKYLNNHNNAHWHAVLRIFAYLKETLDYKIEYKSGNEPKLLGFSDADYAGDVETRRSTTGYLFCLANGPITWSSQRQKIVTLSTTEAEYVAAAAAAAKEAMWLRKLLRDLDCLYEDRTTLYMDNQSAIRLVKNPEFHKRTKHIDIRYHYIRETVANGDIRVEYIPSELQRADILTKSLPKDRFKKMCELMNVF